MTIKFFSRKKKYSAQTTNNYKNFNIDEISPENRNKFIEKNKNLIYSITCKLCSRSLNWENDDELSIALIAFNTACDTYKSSKGSFYNFAKVIIKNSLIDFFRKNKNTPVLLFEEEDNSNNFIDNKNSISIYEQQNENQKRAEEIAQFTRELSIYKLDFNSLIKSSPSHRDTRNNLLNISFSCIKDDSIMDYIRSKNKLPVKQIILLTKTNRKLIERWRIYILCLILILSNKEYVYLRSYLNIKVGDKND
jgi:RNA polymerase sigma factor